MYYWDTLMLAHFCIDTDAFTISESTGAGDEFCVPLRLVHAPNHRALKGTAHIIRAVEELQAEGASIDLTILEGLPNHEIHEKIGAADVVVDQIVIGWYAMFALEGMVQGKPAVCHIRPDLRDLFVAANLVKPNEVPLIDATVHTIKDVLRNLTVTSRADLRKIGRLSRAFVDRHHSIEAIGSVFDRINREINLRPSRATQQ
jgi:hypothetical protein